MPRDLLQDDLIKLVIEADNEGLAKGESPRTRLFENVDRVMSKIGVIGYVLAGAHQHPLVNRIRSIQSSLYREHDITGHAHMGMFMFRDLFARVSVPLIYGEVNIDPLDHINLNPNQIRWLRSKESDYLAYVDQFFDMLDFEYGSQEFRSGTPSLSRSLMANAKFQLHAAAAVMTGAYDFRGAIQSAVLGSELVCKAGIAASGMPEEDIKSTFGHNIKKLVKELKIIWPDFDIEKAKSATILFPDFVKNRYEAVQPSRVDAGRIVMGAQFLASEVTRHLSSRNVRKETNFPHSRKYPPS